MPTVPAAIDYLALINPISPDEVSTFRKTEGTNPGYASGANGFESVLVILFGPGVISRRRWARWARLKRFADANELVFSPRGRNPIFPGSIFTIGDQRSMIDHFVATSEFDYGNYRYVTGKGEKKQTHNWGYLAIPLDRALPHMVLDARANNDLFGATNLPTTFASNQVLGLEGDFPRHFTLYCPREYERDALYIFTPDLMALLIDEAAAFDVEVMDKWMFVYSARPFELLDPAVHQRLLRIVSTVGAKLRSQTTRYVDDHVREFGPNIIAPQGRRLRRGVSYGAVALAALLIAYAVVVFTR